MLTDAEIGALKKAARGDSAKQIAYDEGVTERAIENRMVSVRAKLNARNTTHAVVLAIKAGLIAP
jgi:DNA-binding CsgD family transcriptional regulator